MKLFLPAALLLGAASASAHSAIHGDAARALMQKSALKRKLEDEDAENEDEEEDEEEYSWMQDYKIKFVGCVPGVKFQNQENGEYEYSSVIYRLCDASGECDSEKNFGCDEAYGDYVVGINTYVEAYAESLEQDRRRLSGKGRKLKVNSRRLDDDEFELREFAECGRIEVEDDEDENDEDEDEEVEYFVGPACSEDGKDIVLAMFSDEDCSYASDVDFYELAGQSLPYGDGGLGSAYCQSCVEKNDDGDYETAEFCFNLQEASGGCDQYDQSMCDTIEELTADLRAEEAKGGAKVFWIIVLIVAILAIGWFVMKKAQEKKRASSSTVDTTPIGGGAMS